jgi:hypothetical protein
LEIRVFGIVLWVRLLEGLAGGLPQKVVVSLIQGLIERMVERSALQVFFIFTPSFGLILAQSK